jgi:hypothetical protein
MGDTGQVTQDAAEIYDELFLPALFNEWAPRVAALAELEPGMRVLDVACGTGVLSLAAAESLRAPYSLGDIRILAALFSDAGFPDVTISTLEGTARYPSVRYWMEADIRGWTLSDALDDTQFEMLVTEAESALAEFVNSDGAVEFNSPAHVVTATKC